MEYNETGKCIICNNYYDEKPVLGEYDNITESGVISEFKTAFNLFCKILRVQVDLDLWVDKNCSVPCCDACYTAVISILRLQEVIEETQASQRAQVETLKETLSSSNEISNEVSSEDGDFWIKTRNQLLACLSSSSGGSVVFEKENTPDFQHMEESDDGGNGDFNDEICSPTSDPLQFHPTSATIKVKKQFNHAFPKVPLNKSPTKRVKCGRNKKTHNQKPVRKIIHIRNEERLKVTRQCYSGDHEERSLLSQIKPCSVLLHRLDTSGIKINPFPFQPNHEIIQIKKETENIKLTCSPSTIRLGVGKRRKPLTDFSYGSSQRQGRRRSSLFWLISDNHLLFQNTTIQFSSTSFQCLEEGCEETFEGADHSTFQAIAVHINEIHGNDLDYFNIPRSCPVCKEEYANGLIMRKHLLQHHPSPAVCLICWKPLTGLNPTNVKMHMWTHKNEQEKAEAVAAGGKDFDVVMKLQAITKRMWEDRNRRGTLRYVRRRGHSKTNMKRKAAPGLLKKEAPVRPKKEEKIKPVEEISALVAGPRQSKLKAVSVIRKSLKVNEDSDTDNEEDFVDQVLPPKCLKVDKNEDYEWRDDGELSCSNENTEDELIDSDTPDEIVNSELKVKETTTKTRDTLVFGSFYKNINSEVRKRPRIMAFFLVGRKPKHLLFQNTFVSFSPQGFKCMEGGCSKEFEGTGYNSFQELRYHIMDDHDYREYSTIARSCVLCERKFDDGIQLRNHLHCQHSCELKLVCEACWKPFPEDGIKLVVRHLREHMWSHKSKEEKAEEVEIEKQKKIEGSKQHKVRIRKERKLGKLIQSGEVKSAVSLNPPCRPPSHSWWRISDTLIIFKYTVIQYSGEGLTCTESNCNKFISGYDQSAFEQMKMHVDEYHDVDKTYKIQLRDCPLCNKSCESGTSLRAHFLEEHYSTTYDTCVICWKLLSPSNHSVTKIHMWTHKSKEEKDQVIASGGTDYDKFLEAKKARDRKRTLAVGGTVRKRGRPKFQSANYSTVQSIGKNNDKSFYIVKENLLMFRYTMVEFLQTGLTCQEPECGMTIEGVEYSSFLDMKTHITSHINAEEGYGDLRRSCPHCPEELENGIMLRRHLFKTHPQKPVQFLCEICLKPVAVEGHSSNLLHVHMWTHKSDSEIGTSGIRRTYPKFFSQVEKEKGGNDADDLVNFATPHKCTLCGKEFAKLFHLKQHSRTHIPASLREQFECSYCNIKLLSKIALKSHIERKHRPDLQTKFRDCPICHKRYHYRDGELFRGHVRSHSNESPFICDNCGAGFNRNGDLKKHANTHVTTREFQCEFCEKNFKYPNGLSRHRKKVHK